MNTLTDHTNQDTIPTGEGMGGALICIIGPSGAGKDTAARILSELTGIPVLVSNTTRPMREGEVNGREHWFVSKDNVPDKKYMLAYTQYGGYEYWTELSQIQGSAIYVIDEDGLCDLRQRFPGIKIISIYITASKLVRMKRGVTFERISRDDMREQFPLDYYDYRIINNKSELALRHKVKELADVLLTQ